jgi:putative DNA primase/helicase
MADVAVRNVWVATMNNPTILTELTRRSVPIFLDAKVSEPWNRSGPKEGRSWKHPLPEWAFEERQSLVQAALILIANYVHGDPDFSWPDDKTGDFARTRSVGSRFMGTYERWSQIMGGILAAAGVSGFLANREELHADADAMPTARRLKRSSPSGMSGINRP